MSDGIESLDLNSAKKLLNVERKIESTISQFFKWKTTLKEICEEIKESQRFDFVSISLVSLEQNTIETCEGVGCVVDWINIAKHYLEKDDKIRDIQADIYDTQRTEIITGYDARFDEWLYKRYKHDKFTRVFTPILLVRDNQEEIQNYHENCDWQVIYDDKAIDNEGNTIRSTTSLEINLPNNPDPKKDAVIAVIEAGFKSSENPITEEQGIELAKFVGQYNKKIYETSLLHILEEIAKSAKDIMDADCATLHFLMKHNNNEYIYNVYAGNIGNLYEEGKSYSPHENDFGKISIEHEKYQSASTIPNFQNQNKVSLNPEFEKEGIISSVAFPLIIDKNSEIYGFLCIHYRTGYNPNDKTDLGEIFAERVVNIIANVIRYKSEKDKVNQLKTLHSVASSIAHPPDEDIELLLPYIASNVLNVLAADVVTIYEYNQAENKFKQKPYIAGKLKSQDDVEYYNVENQKVPRQLFEDKSFLENPKPLLIPDRQKNNIFRDSNFADIENIHSVACVKLEVSNILVGLMFINYRRHHFFSEEETELIQTLASSSALAIKNKLDFNTWLTDLIDLERQIITTLNKKEALDLIIKSAVKITNADAGDIRLFEIHNEKLVIKSIFPNDLSWDKKYERISLGQGITGLVAQEKKSKIIKNIADKDNKKDYLKYYFTVTPMSSELCVPIIYGKEKIIIGTLNVESTKADNFNEEHELLLKTIANQAAIAIHNIDTNRGLTARKKLATLGSFSSFFMHRVKSDLSLIKINCQEIAKELSHEEEKNKIINSADSIIKAMNRWTNLVNKGSTKQSVDIVWEIHRAIVEIGLEYFKNIELSIPSYLGTNNSTLQVYGNKLQIREILSNVIKNAQESIKEQCVPSGKIKIYCIEHTSREEKWIKIVIQDNGKGIEDTSKIFNNYSDKPLEKGLIRGQGLFLTEINIDELKGTIVAENNPNEGATFTIYLPKPSIR
ncbi:MAG: GAF domain-containing protein [Cyanobacteria bacterium P01_G01_bin.39]